ncbi:hypothetical protein H0E87_027415, partial [Populus deltoides]
EMSIELSLEDVKCVAFNYGFEVEKEKTIETTYTTNPRSMMQLQSLPSAHAGVVFANIFDFDFFAEPILCCILDNEKEIGSGRKAFNMIGSGRKAFNILHDDYLPLYYVVRAYRYEEYERKSI